MGFLSECADSAKKIPCLRVLLRNTMYLLKWMRYACRGAGIRTREHVIVFSAYGGRSYACSPKAIYEFLLSREEFRQFEFIWLFADPEKYRFLEENPRTRVLGIKTAAADRALHSAKYWILNFRAPDHWQPKKDQIYVQCWHGTPLKKLGYDIETTTNAMNSVREIRAKYRTDAERFRYLLSPCAFATEKFDSAWNLSAAGRSGDILETGYPRDDFLLHYTEEDCRCVRSRLGLEGSDRKVILYTPTWRDDQHRSGVGNVYSCPEDIDLLREKLGEQYVILFRAHYLVANSFDFEKYRGFVYDVSGYDDINELYIISDVLVTDYSSTLFDYAILGRPILFYMYDRKVYGEETRGFYFAPELLPGPIAHTEQELIGNLADAQLHPEQVRRRLEQFNRKFNDRNDGNASRRVAQKLWPEQMAGEQRGSTDAYSTDTL